MNDLFQERGLSVEEVVVPNFNNHLANLIAMILIGDWTAYYLALAYGIDPTPVDMVEDFKDKMKS
jgi:glucose/mannose-6-phosphate isomerase